MKLSTIIIWLESIYAEHGDINVKLNNMDMEDIDLEDMFNVIHNSNNLAKKPYLDIDGIQDYRE